MAVPAPSPATAFRVPPFLRCGAEPERAEAVCVLVHGRGQSPEAMDAHVVARAGGAGVHWVLPRAEGGSWYEARAIDPIAPGTEARLNAALDAVAGALRHAHRESPGAAVVLAGFSQGGCVALEYALRRGRGPEGRQLDGLAVLTGCRVGAASDEQPLPDLAGLPCYLACGQDDPWVPLAPFFAAAGQLARAGAKLTVQTFPGRGHEVADEEVRALDAMLAAAAVRRRAA
jgi:phospholipase/carboxylesterase